MQVLERLDEGVFTAVVLRLGQVKKEKMSKGLVLAFADISRWAASQHSGRLELLRRSNSISALTHVINELASAAGHLHDSIQLEDLQAAAHESLGWLAGNEAAENAVAQEVIREQVPAAVKAIQACLARFPEHRRSKLLGLAALSWCQHQAKAIEAGAGEPDVGAEDKAREETVKAILEGLSEMRDGDLQTLALLSFGWVSFSHPPTGTALLENNGLQLMVAAMQRHPLNRRLQYYACGTVSWLASQPSNRKVPVLNPTPKPQTVS